MLSQMARVLTEGHLGLICLLTLRITSRATMGAMVVAASVVEAEASIRALAVDTDPRIITILTWDTPTILLEQIRVLDQMEVQKVTTECLEIRIVKYKQSLLSTVISLCHLAVMDNTLLAQEWKELQLPRVQ